MIKDRPIPGFIARVMYQMHSPKRLSTEMQLLKSGMIKPGDQILDIGCGPGHLSMEMARLTGEEGQVYAVDIHPLSIECLQKLIHDSGYTNIKPILTDKLDTGLTDESIDIAFIFNTMDMIQNKERLVSELERVMKPGARLVIRNKKSFRLKDRNYSGLFSTTQLKLLSGNGKEIHYKKSLNEPR